MDDVLDALSVKALRNTVWSVSEGCVWVDDRLIRIFNIPISPGCTEIEKKNKKIV